MSAVPSWLRRAVQFVLWQHAGLTAVLLAGLSIRLWLLQWWDTFPFGDVFNFVRIAQELAHGQYPLLEKRLPLYPVLILIVHTVAPVLRWETIAIGLAITASLVSLILLYALCRTLGLTKVASLIAPLFLASYPLFLSYSIRGYADTTFVALFLGSLVALLRVQRPRGAAGLGGLLGLLTLTRYEGVAAAGVLSMTAFLRWRRSLSRIAIAGLTMVLVLLPYVVVAMRAGRSLVPVAYLQEVAEDGVYGSASVAEFRGRYVRLWRKLGLFELWGTPRALIRTVREDPYGLSRELVDRVREPRSAAALLAIAGVVSLLARRRLLPLLIVVCPFLAIAAPVAWYAPYVRYHAFLFPLMALLAAAGIDAGARVLRRATVGTGGQRLRVGAGSFVLVFASSVWLLWFTQETTASLQKSRFRERAYYEAVKTAERLPGIIAFEERRGITEAYFGDRAVYGPEVLLGVASDAGRWQALFEAGVTYVVAQPSRQSVFAFLDHPFADNQTTEAAAFSVEQGNHDLDSARIIAVRRSGPTIRSP